MLYGNAEIGKSQNDHRFDLCSEPQIIEYSAFCGEFLQAAENTIPQYACITRNTFELDFEMQCLQQPESRVDDTRVRRADDWLQ